MSNIIRVNNNVQVTSEHSLGLKDRKKLRAERAAREAVLLCDNSGSMYGIPIQNLRELVNKFPHLKKVQFNSEAKIVEQIEDPTGGTALAEGLVVAGTVGTSRHVILITDGQPNDPDAALRAATDQRLKVDCFFVGDPSDERAQEFLRQLAERTGGKYGATSLSESGSVGELEKGIIALLS